MSDNYVIEIRPHSANVTLQAGIVVRDGRSFIFFTASDVFNPLDGQRFDSPRTAHQAALRLIGGRGGAKDNYPGECGLT